MGEKKDLSKTQIYKAGECVAEGAKQSPYDKESEGHRWHAVIKDHHGNHGFLSAATENGIKEGLSNPNDVKEVLAVYSGQLMRFSERRTIELHR